MFRLGAEPGTLDLCPYPCSSIARNAVRLVTRYGPAAPKSAGRHASARPLAKRTSGDGGMGHLRVQCHTCHEQHWQTVAYEPSHDITAPSLR